jgi:1,4-dihydroxy-2-naphthoyl-CoA hydrolase
MECPSMSSRRGRRSSASGAAVPWALDPGLRALDPGGCVDPVCVCVLTAASLCGMTDRTGPAPDGPGAPAADPALGRALADLRRASRGTLVERMGIELVEVGPRRLVATMPVEGNTQPAGLLHGGASVVLAETLGSIGATLHAGPGGSAVGVEVSASHHASARAGTVTGTATAVHLGRTLATYEVVVTDEAGRRLATARLTCVLRRAPAGTG